jgi:hypothetical protein
MHIKPYFYFKNYSVNRRWVNLICRRIDCRWIDCRWMDCRWMDCRWIDCRWIDCRWIDCRWIDPDPFFWWIKFLRKNWYCVKINFFIAEKILYYIIWYETICTKTWRSRVRRSSARSRSVLDTGRQTLERWSSL